MDHEYIKSRLAERLSSLFDTFEIFHTLQDNSVGQTSDGTELFIIIGLIEMDRYSRPLYIAKDEERWVIDQEIELMAEKLSQDVLRTQ